MPKTREEYEAEQKALTERRRTKRVPLSFQIEVSGRDRAGQVFRDQAVTTDVNEDGCRFDFLRQLQAKDVVAIQLTGRYGSLSKRVLCEVVWAEPNERGWSIGVERLQAEDIWPMKFPPRKQGTES